MRGMVARPSFDWIALTLVVIALILALAAPALAEGSGEKPPKGGKDVTVEETTLPETGSTRVLMIIGAIGALMVSGGALGIAADRARERR